MLVKKIHNIDSNISYSITQEEQAFRVDDANYFKRAGDLEQAVWCTIEWLRDERISSLDDADLFMLKKMGLNARHTLEDIKDITCGSMINKRYYARLYHEILTNESTATLNQYNYYLYWEILYLMRMQD